MASEMTKAILIEIIDTLQMLNKTLLELSSDILANEDVVPEDTEAHSVEIEQWSDLQSRTARELHEERLYSLSLRHEILELKQHLLKDDNQP